MSRSLIYRPIAIFSLIICFGFAFDQNNQTEHCSAKSVAMQNPNLETDNKPFDVYWGLLERIDPERALNDLLKLTGEEEICTDSGCFSIINRYTGSEGLQWAKDYVYEELIHLGYTVEIQDWSRYGYTDQNLIAVKPGLATPDEAIILIAHLDGVGSDGGRYPAADDNATGVVDLLELSRILIGYSFNRTIILLFSTGEEQGTFGVQSYLDQLTDEELSEIQYAINIDMVGYDSNLDQIMELWHGDHEPSLVLTQMMNDTIEEYLLHLTPILAVGCG